MKQPSRVVGAGRPVAHLRGKPDFLLRRRKGSGDLINTGLQPGVEPQGEGLSRFTGLRPIPRSCRNGFLRKLRLFTTLKRGTNERRGTHCTTFASPRKALRRHLCVAARCPPIHTGG